MRNIIHLNFDWKFKEYEECHLEKLKLDEFSSVDIPHQVIELPFNHFDERSYQNKYTYVKYLEIKSEYKEKIIRLQFEGVMSYSEVYVNKKLVGKNEGGYNFFEFFIQDFLLFDEMNEIIVIVDGNKNNDIPPFGGVIDYLTYAGIYREVQLVITDQAYIKDYFVHTKHNKEVYIDIETKLNSGNIIIEIRNQNLDLIAKKELEVSDFFTQVKFDFDSLNLWSINNPHLYHLKIKYNNTDYNDEIEAKFGVREAIFKNDGFYLNGEKIKLIGLNRHQSYPYVGYAMPKSAQVEDADILKYKLGVNIVRTSHYPQSRHFLNRCDEIGLLVFEEIPGWQHIGEIKFKENSFLNLRNMIIKDRNHPSIILWGVRVNESPDDHEFYLETNKIAKSLDPTRQTGGVRNFANSEFLEDVYTYNDFSHTGLNKGIEKKSRITKKVPYLVTEYNGHMFPTKKYDQESKRVAHALRHLNVINEMMDKNNNISGAIGWVMNDYNTHKEFGSGDKVCYHGVLDMFRNFKYAGYAYSSQNSDDYVLEVLSDMNIGDYNAGHLDKVYVLTNLDYIKLYKNDRLIDTFYKDFKTFNNLKNPPIVVSDFIGNILMEDEKLSYKDAEMTKNILKAVTVYGNNLPLKYKLKILYLLKKYKMTYDEGVKMFFKYIGGWGSISPIYKFEGYLNDQLIKTVIKETNYLFDYILESNEKPLVIKETYDVRRYTLKKVNQHKELVNYAFDAFTVKTSGSIELIGKGILSLQGGEISFWIRTIHQGLGYIEIEINDQILIEEVLVS